MVFIAIFAQHHGEKENTKLRFLSCPTMGNISDSALFSTELQTQTVTYATIAKSYFCRNFCNLKTNKYFADNRFPHKLTKLAYFLFML